MASPMLRAALRELKYHPSRYLSTIVAIAISVGFVAASSMVTASESYSTSQQTTAPYSQADLVMTIDYSESKITQSEVVDVVTSTQGVTNAEPLKSLTILLSHDNLVEMASATVIPSPEYLWTDLREGTWPTGDQIALNRALAESLKADVGDQVYYHDRAYTVSGITTQPASTFM